MPRNTDRDHEAPRRSTPRRRPRPRSGDYDIGYGRPPEGTRWPQGVSGNPAGRPRKAPKLMEILEAALNRYIVVKTPDGRAKKTSETYKHRIIHRAVADAAKGSYRETALILKLMGASEGLGEEVAEPERGSGFRRPDRDEMAAMDMVKDYFLAVAEGRTAGYGDDSPWTSRDA